MTLQSLLSARAPGAATPGVTINTLAITQSPHGARKKTWVPKYSNVPARIMDSGSDDQVFFERNGLQVSHIVHLGDPGGRRVKLAVSQGDQIVYGSRIFEIVGVRHPDQLGWFLIVGCQEKTPGLVTGWPTS